MSKLTVADNMILDNILDDFPEHKQSEAVAYLADIYGIEGYGTDYNDCSLCSKEDIEDYAMDDIVEEFGSDVIIQHFDEDTLLDYISIEAVIDKFGRRGLIEKLADMMYKDEFVEIINEVYEELKL